MGHSVIRQAPPSELIRPSSPFLLESRLWTTAIESRLIRRNEAASRVFETSG